MESRSQERRERQEVSCAVPSVKIKKTFPLTRPPGQAGTALPLYSQRWFPLNASWRPWTEEEQSTTTSTPDD